MEIILNQPYSFCQLGKRGNQEDARFPDDNVPQCYKAAFVVCDGVGGQDKGEVASRTVADAFGEYLENTDLSKPFTDEDFSRVLGFAFDALQKRMNSDSKQMATTLAFVCFHSEGVFMAHIGDSRIYHIRPHVGILYQSEDHSLVNALVHSGNITPEEAINHPQGNVITRCIGYVAPGRNRPTATTYNINDVEAGDYFFLCSDGVFHKVDDSKLISILASDKSDKDKLGYIANLSKNSSDNNTAYLIGVKDVLIELGDTVKSDAEESSTSTQSITTVPLQYKQPIVREVEPSDQKSSRFFQLIKKLFK